MIDTLAIIKKYYTPGSLAYTSLVTHCKLVAQKAVYFARKHPELALDITFVEEAAMLHTSATATWGLISCARKDYPNTPSCVNGTREPVSPEKE